MVEREAEIEALAALPDEQIDTQGVPELADWSGKQRGLSFHPIEQQITNQQNNQVYKHNPVTVRQVIIQLLPKDYYDSIIVIGIISGIAYYIYAHDALLLAIFMSIMLGTALEKMRRIDRQHK